MTPLKPGLGPGEWLEWDGRRWRKLPAEPLDRHPAALLQREFMRLPWWRRWWVWIRG